MNNVKTNNTHLATIFFWRADGDGENEKENKVNVLASSEKSIERASEEDTHTWSSSCR